MTGLALCIILAVAGLAMVGSATSAKRTSPGVTVVATILNVAVIISAIYLAVN